MVFLAVFDEIVSPRIRKLFSIRMSIKFQTHSYRVYQKYAFEADILFSWLSCTHFLDRVKWKAILNMYRLHVYLHRTPNADWIGIGTHLRIWIACKQPASQRTYTRYSKRVQCSMCIRTDRRFGTKAVCKASDTIYAIHLNLCFGTRMRRRSGKSAE